eukprot:COSAG01_NODE_1163_length_11454_cov_3.546808_14_plen_219_part_00
MAALVSGGFLPAHHRGTTLEGFVHECDWYATFCRLAGVEAFDQRAAIAGLPPIDSLDVWDLISGANATSPRYEWPITPLGEDTVREDCGGDAAYMAEGRFKLLVGKVHQSGWTGQFHPNRTQPWDSFARNSTEHCTHPRNCWKAEEPRKGCKVGCLFDVLADPEERTDLALTMPHKARQILAKMKAAEKHWFNPDCRSPDPRACSMARETGFYQPYLP